MGSRYDPLFSVCNPTFDREPKRKYYDPVWPMGEMGRSPKVNAKAGRDHWPRCGFCLLTGGGAAPGYVHGASDKHAAYPASDPVSPSDIVATIYHLLGIDPHMTVADPAGRPIPIAHGGKVIRDILA